MAHAFHGDISDWARDHIITANYPVGRSRGIVVDRAEGLRFYDTRGRSYLDATSQLLCVNLGWGQPEIIGAIKEQADRLQYHAAFFGFAETALVECAHKLAELTPPGLDRFVFTAGGAEGNEIAFRIARLYHQLRGRTRSKIVSLYDSYHGLTLATASASGAGKESREQGLVTASGHIHVPSYYCYRCMLGRQYPDCGIACAQFVRSVMEREGADTVAAFIGEPVLGVGGPIAPPPEYWPEVRKICSDFDVLMIADEVMTGFCRTGKMFALENWAVKPDIMVLGKGITSSYFPFGAVALSEEVYGALKGAGVSLPGFTFGGHPIGAAAAVAAMNVYVRDRVADRVRRVGNYALEQLERRFRGLPCVGSINGIGLMLSIEIVADRASRRPFDPSLKVLEGVQSRALDQGLWIRTTNACHAPGDLIKIGPALTATEEDLDAILGILYPLVADLRS